MLFAVKHPFRSSLPLIVGGALAAFPLPAYAQQAPGQAAGQSLPSLPGGDAASSEAPGLQRPLTPQELYDRVRRGVVAIERNGIPQAIGTVLGGDGRILTTLSGLSGSDGADVRYADGTAVHAKMAQSDKELDLALLVPDGERRTEGLSASEVDPSAADLRVMLPSRGTRLSPTEAGVKGQADAHARDGNPLLHLLDVSLKAPPIAGAPLLDSTGSVVAVLVRACKGPGAQPQGQDDGASSTAPGVWPSPPAAPAVKAAAAACMPVMLGAPVSTVRAFLAHANAAPALSPAPTAWLGIRGVTQDSGNVRGVHVTAVAPSSPAEKAGLKAPTDVIAAVDGQAIDSPDSLSAAIGKHAPGDTVKLLVYGGDKFREVSVALRAAP
jgi:S1-C subfamily serine protease